MQSCADAGIGEQLSDAVCDSRGGEEGGAASDSRRAEGEGKRGGGEKGEGAQSEGRIGEGVKDC